MPRDIPVGNGSLLVTFDEQYRIRDIYFPYVGKENHSEGHPFRFGVWVDGAFSWIDDARWTRELRYLPETLVTDVRLTNDALGLEIVCHDAVDFHENIFLRQLLVRDLSGTAREVRLFFHHDFYISESEVGNTAYFDPDARALVHYKGRRYFLISTDAAEGVETFATGRKAFHGQEGTWRDAEDGTLSNHAITEGSVDSTIGRTLRVAADGTAEAFYWIAVGKSRKTVAHLNALVRDRHPQALLRRTKDFWRAWVNKNEIDFGNLPPTIVDLFKRSLLIMRTQIDSGGAIIAANDSDVTARATDHYSYMWPRDGALVAHALDMAGYSNLTRSFFDLCGRIITPEGYFLQKYNPDGSLASGWHAWWDARTKERLTPIQEDETALVIWALWNHYDEFRDIEFIRPLYHSLITCAADFMARFRDPATGLPRPSWNLWEDRYGVHAFTCGTVVGGLRAAANFAELFGEAELAAGYRHAATEICDAMRAHLFRPELGRFARTILPREDGGFDVDPILDASLCGIFYFGAFAPDDDTVRATMRAVAEGLRVRTHIGGIARYEGDGYMRVVEGAREDIPGNPWLICTLWLADHEIATALTIDDLRGVTETLRRAAERALPSGTFAEQFHPLTGAPLSVSPLTWSHAALVTTVMHYLRKLESLQACDSCHHPLFRYDRRARRRATYIRESTAELTND
ncbi:MAG: glycoside hydrolase family 15 protein [Pyrinomonadaceae bacterium]|nr:glycoside hydrolase family 15 protein [Pyrinomonadaceae bacterium]